MINLDHMKLQEGKLWGYGCVIGVTAVKNSVKGMDGVLQLSLARIQHELCLLSGPFL
jgi:hypothetical protein